MERTRRLLEPALVSFEPQGKTTSGNSRANWVWTPLVDVSETKDEYLIRAEVPGLEKDQIKISQDKYNLVISGERKEESENKDERHHTKERF